MKKYGIILLSVLLLNNILLSQALAVTSTSTKSATPTLRDAGPTDSSSDSSSVINKLRQIEKLKDKIATKVAELREKDKTGISGTVKKIENSTITLSTGEGEKKISYADDIVLYQFIKDGRTEQKMSKIKAGNYISVIGIFNEDKSLILGKIIYIEEPSITFFGKIADIDRDNYTLTVKTKDASEIVDIETTTRIFTYGASGKIDKGGFSKLAVGDPIHVVGTARLKESNKVTGGKLYTFPLFNLNIGVTPSANPNLKSATPSATPTSSKSAKPSLTPKATPSKTPTPTKKITPTPTPK